MKRKFIWLDNLARKPSRGAQIKQRYIEAKHYASKGVVIVYRKRRKKDSEYEPSAV